MRGRAVVQFVLGGARQRDLARHVADRTVGDVRRAVAAALGVVRNPATLDFLDRAQKFDVDGLGVKDIAAGIRTRHHPAPERLHLLDRVDRDVTRAGHDDLAALQPFAARCQHLLGEVGGPI